MTASADRKEPMSRSAVMRRVRSKDTRPELIVRRLLFAQGYRYRLHRPDLPGRPDIVFPSRKKIVFVNGCFWHGHNCQRGGRQPKTNVEYWRNKIKRNIERDRKIRKELKSAGWSIITIWECEIKDQVKLLTRLFDFLGKAGSRAKSYQIDLYPA